MNTSSVSTTVMQDSEGPQRHGRVSNVSHVDSSQVESMKQLLHNVNTLAEPSKRHSAVVSSTTSKKLTKRGKLLQEIMETELTYQRHLDLIIQYFLEPLEILQILPNHVLVTIFSNVRQIIDINQELLHHMQTMPVGQAFLHMGPFLKLYSTYANNHERALAALMEWDQKSGEFSEFRRSQEIHPDVGGLKLNALLITPVQRIPRYKLLLDEILHCTPSDHQDYNSIKEACGQVSAVASHINEHIKQQDNFMRMLAIHRSLVGPFIPEILVPGRIFVKEGRLKKVGRTGGRSLERMFFLFSDILMYAKPKWMDSGCSYSCCCVLPLKHCAIERVLGCSKGQGALFTITCKEENLLLYSEKDTVESWINVLRQTIRQLVENRQSLRKESSAKVPIRKNTKSYVGTASPSGSTRPITRMKQKIETPKSPVATQHPESVETPLRQVWRQARQQMSCFSPRSKYLRRAARESSILNKPIEAAVEAKMETKAAHEDMPKSIIENTTSDSEGPNADIIQRVQKKPRLRRSVSMGLEGYCVIELDTSNVAIENDSPLPTESLYPFVTTRKLKNQTSASSFQTSLGDMDERSLKAIHKQYSFQISQADDNAAAEAATPHCGQGMALEGIEEGPTVDVGMREVPLSVNALPVNQTVQKAEVDVPIRKLNKGKKSLSMSALPSPNNPDARSKKTRTLFLGSKPSNWSENEDTSKAACILQ